MHPIWAVCISLFVLGLALLIKHFGNEIIEEEHHFWTIIGCYIVIYGIAAFGVGALLPSYDAASLVLDVPEANATVTLDAVTPETKTGNVFTALLDKISVKNVLP